MRPVILKIDDRVSVKDPDTGEVCQLARHERIGRWTLMAILELLPGRPVAVFEDLTTNDGPMVYADTSGILLELPKTLEPTQDPGASCYRGHTKEEILNSPRDILREEILDQGRDPTYEEVAACFPPIRHVHYGRYWGPHAFVGSRDCVDVLPVYYHALTGRILPQVVAPDIQKVIEEQRLWEGLVGGWLPVVRLAYPIREGLTWDITVFGVVDPPTPYTQPGWYRFLRLENGRVAEAHYFDSYLPYPIEAEPGPERFYAELYRLHGYWSQTLAGAMELDLPERWIQDFCRHAMVLEMITRIGDFPRYGVVDRGYGGPEHNGFQDILNSTVNCFQEWGLFSIAKRYLDNYFTHFVRPDGSVDYRGPSISQYARMLTNLAQYYEFTGDDELLLKYDQKIKAIVRLLMVRREAGKKLPKEDPAYGMITGRHEADISFVTPTLGTLNYEVPYFCNSTETWRGFHDLGRAWIALGEKRDDPELVTRGRALADEAAGLRQDIYRSIERSILRDRDMPYLPLIAGSKEYHLDTPYRSRPESFDDNRVWSEIMHSGVLHKDTIDTVLAYQAAHNGMWLGIFSNRHSVVAFQCYGEAYGLLQHDMIHEFLLFYYAHAAHMHTRGTWSAFECVDMDRDRAEYGPYCSPAQVTIPTITKWMLVFEDPVSPTLWLAKATPRAWLDDGKRLAVKHAPTRWGMVSYEVASRLKEGRVDAQLRLPRQMAAETRLRLRLPRPYGIRSVEVNGEPWYAFDSGEETVTVPAGAGESLDLVIHCS